MNKEFKNFIKAVKEIRLSDAEKAISRAKLSEFISFNPIRGKAFIPREQNYLSIFEIRNFAKATALLLVIAVVVGGSGVSYAASSSLPGEKLYNVKINLNEKIEDGFAFTTEARMVVQSKKVERRLEEAQVLVKEKKFSVASKKIVEDKLEEHITELAREIEILKDAGELESVLETTGKLTPILEAHKEILEDRTENSETLIAQVEDSIEKVEAQEYAIIASVTGSDENETMSMAIPSEADDATARLADEVKQDLEEISEDIKDIVDTRIEKAKSKIREIKKIEAELKLDIEAETSIETTEQVIEIKEILPAETVEMPVPKGTTPAIPSLQTSLKELSSTKMNVVTEDTAEEDSPVKPDEPVARDVEMIIAPVKVEFDVSAKIKEAEALLRDAEDFLERGKFKEALSLAQRVNRIASEIEIHQKLKALELAQIRIENAQKAEVIEAVQ